MNAPIRVLVVGCGHMGTSHALAYHDSEVFELAGLVSRSQESRGRLSERLGGYPAFASFESALREVEPDAVCICTYPDTHEAYATMALEAGCHVFLEKPMAESVKAAKRLVALSVEKGRKLVVGYILQQHPSWIRFVEEAKKLGKPLVMRMNLNQQSSGAEWCTHKNILRSVSPVVDCGVHYVDVMCRMTEARPVTVQAIYARLTDEIPEDCFNYGQLQVTFADGSIGWYEAGWGPMISQTAFFVKDVIGPKGSVSIASVNGDESASVQAHTETNSLILHRAALQGGDKFAEPDQTVITDSEPDHDGLCALEQDFFARAIREDLDLAVHLQSAVDSLRIVLAADEAARSNTVVRLVEAP